MGKRTGSFEEEQEQKPCRINTKLLPIKVHHVVSYGCSAAVTPFYPIVAKEIGISATTLGIVFNICRFVSFLFNPVIGFLVDYFQNIKIIYVGSLIIKVLGFALMLIIPPITYEGVDDTYGRIIHFNESEALLNILKPFERSYFEKLLQNRTKCNLVFKNKNKINYNEEKNVLRNIIRAAYYEDLTENTNKTEGNTHKIKYNIKDKVLFESEDIISHLDVECPPPIDESQIYSTYQFWAYFIIFAVVSIVTIAGSTLRITACLELLGKDTEAYGRLRFFGTLGYGIICPLAGLLYDHFNRNSVIVFLVILLAVDVVNLCVFPLPKAHVSSNMRRDLRIIFTSKEILVFSFGVVVIGFLNSVIYMVEFWFLEEMGANRTLLGLAILMQNLFGEIPIYLISGWLVRTFGHFLCFTFVFAGFVLRLALYYFLENPWLVIPVDTLHGITYGLCHVTTALFGKEKAPKGMEATMLGLFASLDLGLGYGLGSLLGGIGLDMIGPRQLFFFACMLSLGFFLLFLLASYVFGRQPRYTKNRRYSNFIKIL